jgi:hypothetical protein
MSPSKRLSLLTFMAVITTYSHILFGQCKQPISITISDRTTTSVNVTWIDLNTSNEGFDLELIEKGTQRTEQPNQPIILPQETALTQLKPATAYQLFIRTKCTSTSSSKWTGPINFTTIISNPTACPSNIPLKDNGVEVLEVDVVENGILGTDVYLASVDLIVDHGWPADLKIWIESPSGQIADLISNQGLLNDNFGDVNDPLCGQTTSFKTYACDRIEDSAPPFIGEFGPQSSLIGFAKGQPAKGRWKIYFRDRAVKDVGTVKYLKINFQPVVCLPPFNISANKLNDESFVLDWDVLGGCTNTILHLIKPSGDTTSIIFDCNEQNEFTRTINQLSSNTEFTYYLTNQCITPQGDLVSSNPTCDYMTKTLCYPVTAYEDFDNLTLCESSCNIPCRIEGPLFFNKYSTGRNTWIVSKGQTSQEGTGPNQDINGNGHFAYIESNPLICNSLDTIILESGCLEIRSNGGQCDMSYFYNMYGIDVKSLILKISLDNFKTYDTLSYFSGNQGELWKKAEISLQKYHNKVAKIRFEAISSDGYRGDIAIDEIKFFGTTILSGEVSYYKDADGDGYGTTSNAIKLCSQDIPNGYSSLAGDCDDANPNIHPAKPEIPCTGIDENCNGINDDAPSNGIQVSANVVDVSCGGQKDGNISLTITQGQPPYSITWNDGMNGTTRQSLKEGKYKATITDNSGCIRLTDEYEIKAKTKITITDTKIQPSCNGKSDGAIIISHSMDNPPYFYKWNYQDAITKDLSNIPVGTYSIIVSDGKGCVAAKTNIILVPKASIIIDTKQIVHPRCHGDQNGKIDLFVSNGTPPYAYMWNNGMTTSIIQNLKGGIYSCTVTDANQCFTIDSFDLIEPSAIDIITTNVNNIRCFGESSGAIELQVHGGTMPYTYLWNYNFLRSKNVFELPAGGYTITVTDNNGCVKQVDSPIIISQPDDVILQLDSVANAICRSGPTGYIATSAAGGSPPYQFDWNHTLETSSTFGNLIAGTYSVTAFDNVGCKSNAITVNVPRIDLDLKPKTTVITDNTCPDDFKGAIGLTLGAGEPPFDINWSSGRQTLSSNNLDTVHNLLGGIYNVTITDAYGCKSTTEDIQIKRFEPITYTVTDMVQNTCQNDSLGKLSVSIDGGTSPYKIQWNNGILNMFDLANLPSGIYNAIVTDANGCKDSIKSINLTSLSDITINQDIIHSQSNANNGKICITFDGGKAPYEIIWSNGQKDVNCIQNLSPDTYSVTITDDYECTVSQSFVVEETSSNKDDLHIFDFYPNPTVDKVIFTTPNVSVVACHTIQGKQILHVQTNSSLGSEVSFPSDYEGLLILWVKSNSQDKATPIKIIKIR